MGSAFLDHPGPLAFAHRGGAAHAPENSWRAFEHAVGLGYGYLETDVQATADGVLVAFHDRTLTRVTGHPGRVSRVSHRELQALRIGGSEPIPRLEDLLGAWPGIRFNIDVKDAPAIGPLAEVLRRTGAWDRVCLCSFSTSRLRATRRALDREVCMAASPLGAAVVRLGGPRGPRDSHGPSRAKATAGLRRGTGTRSRPPSLARRSSAQFPGLARRHPAVSAVAITTAGVASAAATSPAAGPPPALSPHRLSDWLDRTGVRCLQLPASVVTPPLIARTHRLGLQVHAWTINDRRTMEHLLDLGVDGIMTDETVLLRDVLSARNLWHPASQLSSPHPSGS
jgi:glycerophosphoryl diester phosphodiesterase